MRKCKAILASLFTVTALFTSTALGVSANSLSAEPSAAVVYGDIDNDGKATSADSLAALRNSVGLDYFTETQKSVADVDKDGKVTSADALRILRYSVGLSPDSNEDYNTTSSSSPNTNTSSKPSNTTSTVSKPSNTTSTVSRNENNNTSPVVSNPNQQNDNGHGNYMLVLNTNTKKYHTSNCTAVGKISSANRRNYYVEVPGGTAEDRRHIESEGYTLCKYCEKNNYSAIRR